MKLSILPQIDFKYLTCIIYPRYFEDTEINGKEDNDGRDNGAPTISGVRYDEERKCYYIKWEINLKEGRILNWDPKQEAKVFYKICDDGQYLLSEMINWGPYVGMYSYVPSILYQDEEDSGYGDYLSLKVDKEGRIANWKITDEMIETFESYMMEK